MIWNKAKIQELLAESDQAVIKGLVRIYQRQTEEEKVFKNAIEHNGIGFSGIDSDILAKFAEFYLEKGYLSPKQMAITRNKMKKYWKQLLQLAESNGKVVVYK
jgi:hypothetical protein